MEWSEWSKSVAQLRRLEYFGRCKRSWGMSTLIQADSNQKTAVMTADSVGGSD